MAGDTPTREQHEIVLGIMRGYGTRFYLDAKHELNLWGISWDRMTYSQAQQIVTAMIGYTNDVAEMLAQGPHPVRPETR